MNKVNYMEILKDYDNDSFIEDRDRYKGEENSLNILEQNGDRDIKVDNNYFIIMK